MISLLFWNVTRHGYLISYWHFRSTYGSIFKGELDSLTLEEGMQMCWPVSVFHTLQLSIFSWKLPHRIRWCKKWQLFQQKSIEKGFAKTAFLVNSVPDGPFIICWHENRGYSHSWQEFCLTLKMPYHVSGTVFYWS